MYEYKFVKMKRSYWAKGDKASEDYSKIIIEQAKDGWRLVQIFSPQVGIGLSDKFYELIFEKEK